MQKLFQQKTQTVMNSSFIIVGLVFLFSSMAFSQKKDTIYIKFNNHYDEMMKSDFTWQVQAGSHEEKLGKSITYYIEQMEPPDGYDFRFKFTHSNRSKKTYKKFGGGPPGIFKKEKSFLEDKTVLDIEFFRTTPYIEVCKTFEEEESWEQDVVIFMVDKEEIKNDSIVLREVRFSRPVKE